MPAPKALVLLTQGFEEIEAITPIDLLRRAEVEVTTASTSQSLDVEGKVGVTLSADALLDNISLEDFGTLILPGGPGTFTMLEDERVIDLIAAFHNEQKLIAAICAAPLLLHKAGLLKDRKYTAHFSIAETLPQIEDSAVVKDAHIITSRGAGTAIAFALKIIECMQGGDIARDVAQSIHWNNYP